MQLVITILNFFLGTDSAPHPIEDKSNGLSSKPGIFSAPCSIELYAEIFEQENAINNLEIFSSINGAKFYQLIWLDGLSGFGKRSSPTLTAEGLRLQSLSSSRLSATLALVTLF